MCLLEKEQYFVAKFISTDTTNVLKFHNALIDHELSRFYFVASAVVSTAGNVRESESAQQLRRIS